MGDEKKYYTIQIKGEAYRFAPLSEEDMERIGVVSALSVGPAKTVQVVTRILAESAGPEQWGKITDRCLYGDLELSEITTKLLEKLLKRAAKDTPAEDEE